MEKQFFRSLNGLRYEQQYIFILNCCTIHNLCYCSPVIFASDPIVEFAFFFLKLFPSKLLVKYMSLF
jgi:hypothetical protein